MPGSSAAAPRKRLTLEEASAHERWGSLLRMLPGYDPFLQGQGCEFDEDAAEHVLEFFPRYLRHPKGLTALKPFVLEPWQQSLLANLFGWKRFDKDTGRWVRRFKQVFIYCGKKNGKSVLAAGIILYTLLCDGEQGAEIYSAASSREQAALIFGYAKGMVNLSPALTKRLRIYGGKERGGGQPRSIVHEATGSSYKCLAADANTADGPSPHLVVIDELHRHRDAELSEVLRKSAIARLQPIILYTTTADFNRPSPCNTLLGQAKKVRDNHGDPARVGYDPSFLPVIYEASKDDDWHDPKTWRKANPNLGVTFREEDFAKECRAAEEMPTELANFLRLNLNIVTDADEVWLPGWKECHGLQEGEDAQAWRSRMLQQLAGSFCLGALDLSKTKDLTAFVLWFPEARVALPWFWIPRETARKAEDRDRVPYQTWRTLGFADVTEGNVTDYDHVRKQILEILKPYECAEVAYDPWNATQMALQLQEAGVKVIEYRQGYASMSEPAKDLERRVLSRELEHGANPVLEWNAGNAMVERDPAGNIKPSKRRSTGRIDGIVSLVMALGRGILTTQAVGTAGQWLEEEPLSL